jgi:simple sugar transport system permease protein
MFISGAFYGLAGGLEIFGTYYGAVREFTAGQGWNGLAAALIASFRPGAVVPAALFFAWINSGARIAMQNTDLTVETATVVQSAIFFLITSRVLRDVFIKRTVPGNKLPAAGGPASPEGYEPEQKSGPASELPEGGHNG